MAATPEKTRRRAAHLGPERRRPLILDVALDLFMEHGYKGTSMDAVAQAAGVTKPVIYDCFASKAELFGALLDREEQRMFERFGAALLHGARPGDLEGTLAAGFAAMLTAAVEAPRPYRVALMSDGDAAAAIAARVRRGRERQIGEVTQVAREWLRGAIPAERLDATALFVGHTVMSIGEAGMRMILAEPDRWSPDELARRLARLAAGGYPAALS